MPPSPPHDCGWPNAEPSSTGRKRFTVAILLCFAGAIVAIWLRNRDILRDLYDCSSVIVAVGKVESGLRPYVDFRSTMQSATYALNWGVELLFGANYLALTWGGLLVSLGGGAALAWMWRRSFGGLGAALLAGTIAVAGLAQHVLVFYNSVGLLCFALVSAGLAYNPRMWPVRSLESVLVALALVLGGTNKVNFQALTLAAGAMLIGRAWLMRELPARAALASWGLLLLLGAVVPVGLELAWTGATLRTWTANVLILPSERVGFVTEFFRRDVIFHPAYDIYHHFLFKQLTAAGLVLVAGTAFAAWRGLAGSPVRRRALCWLLAVAPMFALGGILLTVTNVETLALTSLGFLVGAAAIWAALTGGMPASARRRGAAVLPVAGLLWTVVGGYAAWEGSRVLFGAAEPHRGSFVRLENPPPAIAYLRGVRLDADLHTSLRLAAAELERLRTERGNLSTVLFGPAMEWMERAYPESILRGMPVWYHQGTSLQPGDSPWLEERLASRKVDRIVLNPSWEAWPGAFRTFLERHFRSVSLGPTLRLYEARGGELPPPFKPEAPASLRPLMFCRRTHSNIHLNVTRFPGDMRLCPSPWGDFVGRPGNSRWIWTNCVHVLEGAFVAVLQNRDGAPVTATWRILAGDEAHPRVLQSGETTLNAEQPEYRTTFEALPHGEPLRFEIEVPTGDAGRILAGWRDLWIKQAGAAEPTPPPVAVDNGEDEHDEDDEMATFIRHPCTGGKNLEDGWYPAPFEAWKERPAGTSPWKVRVNTKRRHDLEGSSTIVCLVWYKSGRIEILREATMHPNDEESIELEGWMPEPGGWVGVFARSADLTKPPNCRVKIESWNF